MAKAYKVVLEINSFPQESREGITKVAENWVEGMKIALNKLKHSIKNENLTILVSKKTIDDFGGLSKFKERNALALLYTIQDIYPMENEAAQQVVNSLKYYTSVI